MTKKQKKTEAVARICEHIAGTPNNRESQQLRARNRRVEKKKTHHRTFGDSHHSGW